MADDTKTTEKSEDTKSSAPKKAATEKYCVREGCGIFVESGKKAKGGDVVELTKKQARQFKDQIEVYDGDDDDEKSDDT